MTLKTRRILFYGFFAVFIPLSFGIIFYSQGWRLNAADCKIAELQNCKIKFQKTGAIYIETEPKNVIIKINNKIFKDKSGLVQNGTLISDLLPKIYKIEIEKDGYLAYQKSVKVEPNLVSEIPYVVLIPEKIEKKQIPLPEPAEKFWLSSNKIVFKNNKNLYYLNDFSLTAQTNISKLRGDEFIVWSENGKKFIVKDSKNKIFYLYETNNLSKFFNINASFNNLKNKSDINKISFHPADSDKLIIQDKNSLNLFDLSRLRLETIVDEPIIFWTIKNQNVYYLAMRTDADSPRLSAGQTRTNADINKYFLKTFNLTLKTNNQIAAFSELMNQLIISPDNEKLAFWNENGEISVYFIKDDYFGVNKKAGETIVLNDFKEQKIEKIFWRKDSYHLFITTQTNADLTRTNTDKSQCQSASNQCKSVSFTEIDDRLPINKYALAENIADSYYDLISDKFYFIQNNKLYYFVI